MGSIYISISCDPCLIQYRCVMSLSCKCLIKCLIHKFDHFILAFQFERVFYVQDQLDQRWSIVL